MNTPLVCRHYLIVVSLALTPVSATAQGALAERGSGEGQSGGGTPSSAGFTVTSPSQSPASIAAGQTVALRFNVRSSQAASNVDAYVVVQHSGGQDVRFDQRGLSFHAGETKTLLVNYTARATDRIGTKFWTVEIYQDLRLKVQIYTRRPNINMNFQQTTGVAISAPFGPEYDNLCDNESTSMYVPCSLGSITVNLRAMVVNDYFADGYRVIPAGCAESGLTVVCEGGQQDVTLAWSGSATTFSDVPSAANITSASTIDPQLGDARTLAIIEDTNVAADSAADFCASLEYSGFNDWHLPSKSELALLYCRSTAPKASTVPQEMPGCSSIANYGYGFGSAGVNSLGNPNGLPFNPGTYLSSTEVDAGHVWALDFSTGQEIVIPKSEVTGVRCIRKPYGLKF